MFERLRETIRTGPGKAAAIAVVAVLAALAVYQIKASFGNSFAAALSRERVYICAETGKTFTVEIAEGNRVPVYSPYSKQNTGYPPEYCFWTTDGKVAKTPTLVLLNAHAGKPGPTFCPDCGRLVVHDNPPASEATTPPPTREQYESRHRKKAG